MADAFPLWADHQLSSNLPSIRAIGEGPSVEFKEAFPEQGHRLAQELAALGTSGGGVLYIGINGDVVGIQAIDGDTRDESIRRAQGLVSMVRPKLRAEILFAVENNTPVLAIRVPLQEEPVFYYDSRPYIRDGRESRPATPEEVKERVWAHPSSEMKRRKEDLAVKHAEMMHQMDKSFAEQNAERNRMADEALFRRVGR